MAATGVTVDGLAGIAIPRAHTRSFWSRAKRSLGRSMLASLALLFLILLVVSAVFAPFIAPTDPLEQDIANAREAPVWWPSEPGHGGLLGADALGRDVLSRIIYGSRVSLLVGTIAVLVSGVIGIGLGLVAGYYEGWADNAIMRIADAQLSLPFILLAIAIIAVLGPSLLNLILVLAITGWTVYARLVRGDVLSVKRREYIEACRVIGLRDIFILFRHILPNVLSPVLVIASFSMAQMIIAEASLSFLGLGVQPPTPTWGGMLAESREYFQIAPWISIFPGLAIMLTVLAVNLLGDWLRDLIDPRLQV